MKYYQMPAAFEENLELANQVFAYIFNLECLMKLIGLGCSYFDSSWNKFDFLVVLGTNAGLLV